MLLGPLIDGGCQSPARQGCAFDYKRAADGTVVNDGHTVYARRGLACGSAGPPSVIDDLADAGDQLPALDELDFALLRVQDAPRRAKPLAVQTPSWIAPKRGWINRVGTDGFEAEHPLFLLQHPEGAPLKLAFGPSAGLKRECNPDCVIRSIQRLALLVPRA